VYYVHSFVSEWLRTRLGYTGQGREEESRVSQITNGPVHQQACKLHSAIAACWMDQLAGSRRISNLNISRALEAFHHLVAAGEADRLQEIAANLLSGNLEWAIQQIERLYMHLFNSKAPIAQLRAALQYAAILDPDDHKVQRFLGECRAQEEGRGSPTALACFEKACALQREFPPYWANLGRTMLARGKEGASAFLNRLNLLEQDCPEAIDEHVRAIQLDCLKLSGKGEQAAVLRM
jgi:hypothetical protein